MIKVLEQAIDKIRTLPEDRQAYAAKVLEQIAAAGIVPFEIPEDHKAGVQEGLDQAKRGELVYDGDGWALEEVRFMRLRYAPRARSDISEIHDYIAQFNRALRPQSFGAYAQRAVCWRGIPASVDPPICRTFAFSRSGGIPISSITPCCAATSHRPYPSWSPRAPSQSDF